MSKESPVKFGTDGWRGVIADDFTFENVRVAAAAIANYVLTKEDPKKGVFVAYDTRFGSPAFAAAVAEVLAGAGIPVQLADRITPTPALSYAVKQLGAAGGVMITSSHNPAQWNGVKYKASYGGSGSPSIMADIESLLGKPLPSGSTAKIDLVNFVPPYVDAIQRFVDLDLIAKSGFRFAIDCMYGAGAGILAGIFSKIGVDYIEIRANPDPLFPGINPEPIEPHVRACQEIVVEKKCDAGLITDGDADRIGAADENGNFVAVSYTHLDVYKRQGVVMLETQQTSDLTYRMYDYGSSRELHLEKAFAAMHLVTNAGIVPPRAVDGHSVLIDERYFRIEKWPMGDGAAALEAPAPVVQMLFITQGNLHVSGDGFEPFAVERNQLAVIPSSSPRWTLAGDGSTEIIRILPAAD